MGLLLMALGIEFIVAGVKGIFPGYCTNLPGEIMLRRALETQHYQQII
jgi:hypothetical protein